MNDTKPNMKLPEHLQWSDEKKRDFYISLAQMNYIEAAKHAGLGAHYNSDNSLRAMGYKIFKSLRPLDLGIAKDTIEIVTQAIENRKVAPNKISTDGAQPELLDPEDTKQLVIGGKNKAAILLHKKFDRLMKNNKALDEVSLSQLATTFGILFDKSQIIRGESTENIAVMAKVSTNMTPEESLEALLKMREFQQEKKHE